MTDSIPRDGKELLTVGDWVPRVTLRQLAYFVAAAQLESMVKAAEELHVSPPSITTAIAGLEAVIGTQLFLRRHARGLVLTQSGRDMVVSARGMLMSAREMQSRHYSKTGELEGVLDIGCLVSFAPYVIPPLIRGFVTHNPRVRVRWHEADHAALVAGLEEGALDGALLYDFDIPSSVQCTVLRKMPSQIVISEAHSFARRRQVSLADMIGEPYVLLDLPRSRDYFLLVFAELGLEPKTAYRARSFEMARSLVASGFGYTLLNFCPPYSTSAGGIVSKPIKERTRAPNLTFGRLRRYAIPRLVREFLRFTMEFVGQFEVTTHPQTKSIIKGKNK